MTIYADILFLVNFSMDLLTLYLAARITHTPAKRMRILLASVFGGGAGTLLAAADIRGFAGSAVNLLLMTVMTMIAFGGKRNLIRHALVVCGTGTLLSGIMTAILSLGEPVMMDYGSAYPSAFLGCTAAAWLFTRVFMSEGSKTSAEVRIMAEGKQYCITALCDSGCFLTEPISGTPVITVSEDLLGELAVRIGRGDASLRIRMIPVKTVAGDGLLYGFVPDSVTVNGNPVNAVVAVDRERRGGFDGIVPAALVHNNIIKKKERGE